MITTDQAILSLRPGVEWTMNGNDVENIVWHTPNVEPLTTLEVNAEIQRLEALQLLQAATAATARQAVLDRLGITAEEAQIILGGSN
jgi:hypothetical protein